jgi:glycosyltransferase involved in cell wall biosynthesis
VIYLPWEFGPIPSPWVAAINAHADEVWATTRHVAGGFLRSGVDAARVGIVGHGAPDDVCSAQATRLPEGRGAETKKPPFVFLFNSGFLWRKGVDLLLAAYFGAFSAEDNVKLVLHAVYGDEPVFSSVEAELRRREGTDPSRSPKVELQREYLDAQGLAELFRSANVMVHSSRSEGFGLGVVEAMARGIPVVLPDFGPPGELLANDTAFLVPARMVPCRMDPCSQDGLSVFTQDWPVPVPLEWGHYEPEALGAAMRRAYESPEEARRIGERGREFVCRELTWGNVYEGMKERLLALANRRRLKM